MLFKKVKKDVPKLLALGVGVGVGQSLATGADLSPLTSKMPVMAGMMGAGMVLDELTKLKKKVPKF